MRVRAAGICHSDAHYRAGRSSMGMMPITLGHEVAGEVEWVGSEGNRMSRQATGFVCTTTFPAAIAITANTGNEQFCTTVQDDRASHRWRLCGIYRSASAQRDPTA